MAALPTGRSVRWAVSEATGWRETPDSPARPTSSGVDPNLGVWVSLHHLQPPSHPVCYIRERFQPHLSLLSEIYEQKSKGKYEYKTRIYLLKCFKTLISTRFLGYIHCVWGHYGKHLNKNLLEDIGSQFNPHLIHFTYILFKGIHLFNHFFLVYICQVLPQSGCSLVYEVKLDLSYSLCIIFHDKWCSPAFTQTPSRFFLQHIFLLTWLHLTASSYYLLICSRILSGI